MKTVSALLAFLFTVAWTTLCFAQAGEEPQPAGTGRIGTDFVEKVESQESIIKTPITDPAAAENGSPSSGIGLMPTLIDPAFLDEAGVRSMQESLKAFYDYNTRGFEHRSAVFKWQLLSSRLIFGLVILIVAVGLYFSWLQFMAGMRENGDLEKTATTLEASPTSGIKVSSPVLGVIILTLSLAFFYLYLVHVYPIEEIF